MTDEELKAIEERANAATPGPWVSPWTKPDGVPDPDFGIDDSNHFTNGDGAEVISVMWHDGPNLACTEPDSAFIAAARSDIPALVAAMREREMVIKTLSHAMMKAHEEIAAGKLTVASNRLALALSLVVPSRRAPKPLSRCSRSAPRHRASRAATSSKRATRSRPVRGGARQREASDREGGDDAALRGRSRGGRLRQGVGHHGGGVVRRRCGVDVPYFKAR